MLKPQMLLFHNASHSDWMNIQEVERILAAGAARRAAIQFQASEKNDYFENLDFHLLDGRTICRELNVILSSGQGLDSGEAAARLSRDGKNLSHGVARTISKSCSNTLLATCVQCSGLESTSFSCVSGL